MSQLGVLAGSLPVNHITACRAFEGILLSPCGLLGPEGKLHDRPFTRKQKAENPSAEDGWYMGTRSGQLPSDQLPLADQLPVATTRSSEENHEWWAVSTSADGSLDISAILQKTFLGTDTCKSIAEPNGFRLASMVSAVSASCGLSCSAIWGASAQQQKLRTCIEQTIAERRQLLPTEQAPPVQTLPTAEAAKPISCDGKQQALPCSKPVSEACNRGAAQVLVKASIEGKKPPEASYAALPLRAGRMASAFGKRIRTEAKAVPCTGGTLVKLEPMAYQGKAAADMQGKDAAAPSKGGIAAEQPVLEVQKPSKRLKLMSAVPPRAASTIKQEETQNICRDAEADNSTIEFTGVHRPQSALCGLIKPPQKAWSRRPQCGSNIVLRSRGGNDANVSFHTAAAAPGATANTAQPKAMRRLLESMKRSKWGAHRSIKQLNTDCRGHVNYKPQSGYF